MLSTQYLVLLTALPGFSKKQLQTLLSQLTTAIKNLAELAEAIAQHTHQTFSLNQLKAAEQTAAKIFHQAKTYNIDILGFYDTRFPQALRQIPDPPVVLYHKGNVEILNVQPAIAVIGTRTPVIVTAAQQTALVKRLVAHDCVIVSGLAQGCDTLAHQACLEAQGKTIAVLAHGLDTLYPASNKNLAKNILAEGGCLISEYPPGTPVKPYQLVARDRLQSGLANAIIVIETALKGGTMHTAQFAKKQNKLIATLVPEAYPHAVAPCQQGNAYLLGQQAYQITAEGDYETELVTLLNKCTQSNAQKKPNLQIEHFEHFFSRKMKPSERLAESTSDQVSADQAISSSLASAIAQADFSLAIELVQPSNSSNHSELLCQVIKHLGEQTAMTSQNFGKGLALMDLLLTTGANPNWKNYPLKLALSYTDKLPAEQLLQVVDCLESHGASIALLDKQAKQWYANLMASSSGLTP